MKISNTPIVYGKSFSGQSIYLQSQTHANETHSTPVLYSLIHMLQTINVTGEVIVWPCINRSGFKDYCVNKVGLFDPDNGQNWNRIDFHFFESIIAYFDRKLGQINSFKDIENLINELDIEMLESDYGLNKHAYIFFKPIKMLLKSKYIIDIHTPEFGVQHLYCNAVTDFVNSFKISPTIVDDTYTPTFRKNVNMLFDRLSKLNNKYCCNYFSKREIVTVELPSNKLINNEYISYWTKKLIDVLVWCGFVKGDEKKETITIQNPAYDIRMLKYYYAKIDGIFILDAPIGSIVEKGELIMRIFSVDGAYQSIRAIRRGIFLCFRDKKMVSKGEWVARILELE